METEGFEFARGLFDGDESPAKAKKAKAGAGAEGGAGAGRKKKKNAPPGKLCVDEIKVSFSKASNLTISPSALKSVPVTPRPDRLTCSSSCVFGIVDPISCLITATLI